MKKRGTILSLQIVHRALLLGLVLFAAVAFWLKHSGKVLSPLREKDQLLQLVAIAISFAAVFIGASIFKKKTMRVRGSRQSIAEKAAIFRAACVVQWALLEVASMFCIICFLLVGNLSFLALAATLMLWFALTGPSKSKTILLLRLADEELEGF